MFYSNTWNLQIKKILLALCLALGLASPGYGQTLNALLNAYGDGNANGYLRPLADLFGAGLNTGARDWAKLDSGFHIRLTAVGTFTFPAGSLKTFEASTPESFTPSVIRKVPTVIGKNETVSVEGVNGTSYSFPTGYNLKYLLLMSPQLSAGSFLNTELNARFFTFDFEGDLGKLNYFGAGLRHSLDQYFGNWPIALNLSYMYQNLEVGDEISISSHLPALCLGQAWRHLSYQVTAGYLMSRAEVNYNYTYGNESENFSLRLENDFPVFSEVSLSAKFGFLILHTAASYSGTFAGAGGITFKF